MNVLHSIMSCLWKLHVPEIKKMCFLTFLFNYTCKFEISNLFIFTSFIKGVQVRRCWRDWVCWCGNNFNPCSSTAGSPAQWERERNNKQQSRKQGWKRYCIVLEIKFKLSELHSSLRLQIHLAMSWISIHL